MDLSMSEDVRRLNPEFLKHPAMSFDTRPTELKISASWKDFESEIISWLQQNGWKVAHFRPAKTEQGWRTAVSADGKGFPDILALKGDKMVIIEAKTGSGKLSTDQFNWLSAFQSVGAKVFVATPEDWMKIKEEIEAE